MKKKFISLLLVTAMISSFLIGCSKTDTGSENGPDTPNTENQTEEAGGESGEAEKITLNLALWDYEAEGSPYKDIIEGFQQKYPNIQLNVTSTANADYDTKLSTMLAGGDGIDVFFGKSNTQYPTLVLKDYALPLDDLISSHNVNLSAYGNILDRHYILDGSLYALPFRTNDWVIFYNKKLFDKANVPYPTNDMTWEEFREIGKKVTTGSGATLNYGISFIPKTSFIVPALLGITDNFDILTSDFKDLKYPMEYITTLQNEDKSYEPYAESKSMNQDQTYFFKGTSAMLYNGSWFVQMLVANSDKIDFEWGVVKQPYWEGTEQKGFATSTPILIHKKTAHPEEAFKFLAYMTGEEGAGQFAEKQLIPSYMTDDVLDKFKEATNIDDSSMEALTGNTVYSLGAPNVLMGIVSDMMNEELELYITGNQTVDETIESMSRRRTELIEQNQ